MSVVERNQYEGTDEKPVFTKPTPPAPEAAGEADPSDVFWELAGLCYQLFTILGKVGQLMNDKLKQNLADLTARNSAQALALESGPPALEGNSPNLKAPYNFGGPAGDPVALKRANDLADYLHSFGIATDFPKGYATDHSTRVTEADRTTLVTVQTFNNWIDTLKNQVEQLKNDSSVESTKAEGTLKSASAAIDLSTSVIKNQNSYAMTVASALKM